MQSLSITITLVATVTAPDGELDKWNGDELEEAVLSRLVPHPDDTITIESGIRIQALVTGTTNWR